MNNCLLTGNHAGNGAGASFSQNPGVMNHCTLTENSASSYAGGALNGTLNNCLLTGNSAAFPYGGGAYGGTLVNSIAVDNTAPWGTHNYFQATFTNSCTTPDPGGTGNITNAPQFIATNDFHLVLTSPGIDAGDNTFATNSPTDFDGNPRIVNGTVDMGAYEYNPTLSDSDTDGFSDAEETIAGTQPTNAASFFAVQSIPSMGPAQIQFASVTGRLYAAEYNADLMPNPQVWTEFTNNIPGTGGALMIMDTDEATNRYYRVRVMLAP